MQRTAWRAKNSLGVFTDTGDDGTAYALAAGITIGANTVVFTAKVDAGGLYSFEAKGVLNNSAAETVTLGIGPQSSVAPTTVELAYLIPAQVFAFTGGGNIGWNATTTNGTTPGSDFVFGAGESKPFMLFGGVNVAAGGTFSILFNKTVGAGTLIARTWSQFVFRKTNV